MGGDFLHSRIIEIWTDLRDIGFGVEVSKQNDERDHVDNESVLHPEREIATRSYAVDAQNQSGRELNELEDRQVLLPPEVLADGGS